jgi:glycosyltransferase involved in cell wall biosynthesis
MFNYKNKRDYSVSVIIPAKNEQGNIEHCLLRMPEISENLEIIFIEGGSTDETWNEILRVQQLYNSRFNIKALKQKGTCKADAVYTGFAAAKNEVLMILDADLTIAPEDLPKFYDAICQNQNSLIIGCRIEGQDEKNAMPKLNTIGNKFFSITCSWMLKQNILDTLCGTKVLFKRDYLKISATKSNIDPFGDFELLFGANKLNLTIISIPVKYYERSYGKSNISPIKDGFLLLKMLIITYKKLRLGY